jgi:Zn-dependent peptidase ImmA (M78 family)/transcriptional regulator with XRE-family HTH domain
VQIVKPAFQPERLKLARKLRDLRQNELATTIGVTPAAISQYESGTSPRPDVIERLAMALKCLPSFFFREPLARDNGGAYFRSLRRAPQHARDRAESFALLLAEIASMLDEDVELPLTDLPARMTITPDAADTEIEDAAIRLRAVWSIPPGPIPHIVRLLETHGVVVAAVDDFHPDLDAFSLWAGRRPVTILCTGKGTPKRRRFDAAHELAHLVLHDAPKPGDKIQEQQAHRFASALLMPPEEIEPWLPRRSNQIELLQQASETWGVSMQALLFRARTLGVLGESSYVRAMKRMSALGWRSAEPVEAGPEETPAVLVAAVAGLREAGGSLERVAERIGLPAGRLSRMLSVPELRDEAQVLEWRGQAAAV